MFFLVKSTSDTLLDMVGKPIGQQFAGRKDFGLDDVELTRFLVRLCQKLNIAGSGEIEEADLKIKALEASIKKLQIEKSDYEEKFMKLEEERGKLKKEIKKLKEDAERKENITLAERNEALRKENEQLETLITKCKEQKEASEMIRVNETQVKGLREYLKDWKEAFKAIIQPVRDILQKIGDSAKLIEKEIESALKTKLKDLWESLKAFLARIF